MRMLAHLFGAAAVVVSAGWRGPPFADCYDILGCTDRDLFSKHFEYLAAPHPTGPNCNFLWVMRNSILRQHGYCFHTARGESEEIGNEGLLRYSDVASVPLNSIERANIATIARAERLKSCP